MGDKLLPTFYRAYARNICSKQEVRSLSYMTANLNTLAQSILTLEQNTSSSAIRRIVISHGYRGFQLPYGPPGRFYLRPI